MVKINENRNRLYNNTRKILSVASPQSVVSVRDGIRRNYRWRQSSDVRYRTLTVPPLLVLKAFYENYPSFRIEEEAVFAEEALDYKRVLGDVDRTLVEAVRSSPSGLLDRNSLAELCVARGMNENTFNVYTTYSPIIEHVEMDIWKLRGTKVDPSAIEAIRIENHLRPRQRRVLQYGWNEEGKLWIAARVPKMPGSMMIGCPTSIQRFLRGQDFPCVSKEDNHQCGTISVNDRGLSSGYGVFTRRYGVDENDLLLIEFDLSEQTAALSIADEELLDLDE